MNEFLSLSLSLSLSLCLWREGDLAVAVKFFSSVNYGTALEVEAALHSKSREARGQWPCRSAATTARRFVIV